MVEEKVYFSAAKVRAAIIPFVKAFSEDPVLQSTPNEYAARLLTDDVFNLDALMEGKLIPLHRQLFEAAVEELKLAQNQQAEPNNASILQFLEEKANWTAKESFGYLYDSDYIRVVDAQKRIHSNKDKLLSDFRAGYLKNRGSSTSRYIDSVDLKLIEDAMKAEERIRSLLQAVIHGAFCGVGVNSKPYEAIIVEKINSLTEFIDENML